MRMALSITAILILAVIAGLALWRRADHRADRAEWDRLSALQPAHPPRFDPAMVADLPAPAQRYFRFAIQPGTPLLTVARIDMAGQFGMGDKAAPGYLAMTARQILAAPEGFVWKMRAGRGLMRLSGSDSASWTRFWVMGLLPVARLGGNADHARSAFGRYVAEAVFWTPAALLPGPGIEWQAVDENTARVTLTRGSLSQTVTLRVDGDGRPLVVEFQRWSDANPERRYRLQPFGGTLSQFRAFDGFTLPTHIEAGNMFGTEAYFPFFIVDVGDIIFPGARN